ncbi:MAG: hypothetical protein QM755_02755 [Luteolibacter sp.]
MTPEEFADAWIRHEAELQAELDALEPVYYPPPVKRSFLRRLLNRWLDRWRYRWWYR